MGRHARLARTTHAVPFLGLGEDHRRLTTMGRSRRECSIEFAWIVATALERIDLG